MEIIESQRMEGYVAKATVDKFFYYAKILRGEKDAREILSMVMGILKECSVDNAILEKEQFYNLIELTGFEVAEELVYAIANNLEALVTLNAQKLNYMGSIFPVLSVKQVLDRQPLENSFLLSEPIDEPKLEPETSLLNTWQTELDQKRVKLNNWLGNDFREAEQENWHPWEAIVGIIQQQFAFRSACMDMDIKRSKGVKKISWDNECQMALVVDVAIESNNEVVIILQLYAISKPNYLPENTKMIVLDDSGKTFLQAESKLGDLGIQLRFSADYGEQFSVKIDYNNYSFTELFMV
ncbi:DUF1822 family protein [Moorena producens]|uniref:DUF1822 family protein n=1 Tax=Moorena producens TaxID=1155739 RepID=UPI0013144CF5|nr:DUF1822 family protein [Moorena producens]